MIKLIVGLGNPGQKYTKTRHNAGFLLLDGLAKDFGVEYSTQSKFFGQLAEFTLGDDKVFLLKPMTFMNRSGQSVSAVMKYYKIKSDEILVLHDELDFETGVLRFKRGGGHGGHNGLRDIIASLSVRDFVRLRIGINRPAVGKDVADYVLADFSKKDFLSISGALDEFVAYFPQLHREGYESVMQALHSRKN